VREGTAAEKDAGAREGAVWAAVAEPEF